MRCTELHPRTNIHVMEVPIMTFYGYMKRNYYNKEGRKADLANDDPGIPGKLSGLRRLPRGL